LPESVAISPELVNALADALKRATLPEALTADDAATVYGISRALFYSYDKRGLVPQSVQIGDGPRRWLRSECLAHLASGAPSRRQWQLMRTQAMRRAG
jgi:predicted DNA-binding transcriptional regulator AlpA